MSFVNEGGLEKLVSKEEEESKNEKINKIGEIEEMKNLDAKQKTISMPDPPKKLSTFVERKSQFPESV